MSLSNKSLLHSASYVMSQFLSSILSSLEIAALHQAVENMIRKNFFRSKLITNFWILLYQ